MKNLVLLKKGSAKNSNVFLIHAGNGEVQNYVLFSSFISPKISCWAIRADRFTDHTPVNRSIPIMAANYIKIIREIQPKGPYYIAGWCFGGIRAFEIALQLEAMGEEVRFLSIFNSHVPILDDDKRLAMVKNYSLLTTDACKPKTVTKFSEASERALIDKWLKKAGLKWTQSNKTPYDRLWTTFVDEFGENSKLRSLIRAIKEDIPPDRALAIPYYDDISLEKLIYYLAVMRTDANAQAFYIPKRKVKATAYYFAATDSLIEDRQDWNQYTSEKMTFHNIKGTHFSIFHPSDVHDFAKLFDRELIKHFHI